MSKVNEGSRMVVLFNVLFMAIETSDRVWKLGFGDRRVERYVNCPARNIERLLDEIKKAIAKFKLPADCKVYSCYEAGREGFWIDRCLRLHGIESLVVDPSSIEGNRRTKKAKTDRIDARKILNLLVRYVDGERKHCSMVQVPPLEMEVARREYRERNRLKKEMQAAARQIESLLHLHGIAMKVSTSFPSDLRSAKCWDDKPVPETDQANLLRIHERWTLARSQLKTVTKSQSKVVRESEMACYKKVRALQSIVGVDQSALLFVMEFFGWRTFKSGKEVGALAGLTATPFKSGGIDRELGIGKSGNQRVRQMAVQIAWLWIRHQPDSEITKWYRRRFAQGPRFRKIGIVAVARKILILFWRYLEFGEVPPGVLVMKQG